MKKYIPIGSYCYDKNGLCKWWKYIETIKIHRNTNCEHADNCKKECWSNFETSCQTQIIRCEYMNYTDIKEESLLWDQCKECGEHDYDEKE